MSQAAIEYVETAPGGGWRISGSRVSLASIVYAYWEGKSPEAIVEEFPTLSAERVYAPLPSISIIGRKSTIFSRNKIANSKSYARRIKLNMARSWTAFVPAGTGTLRRDPAAVLSRRGFTPKHCPGRAADRTGRRDYIGIDEGLSGTSDAELLQIAWDQHWLLISHDVNTMKSDAEHRVATGGEIHGLFLIPQKTGTKPAADSLVLIGSIRIRRVARSDHLLAFVMKRVHRDGVQPLIVRHSGLAAKKTLLSTHFTSNRRRRRSRRLR